MSLTSPTNLIDYAVANAMAGNCINEYYSI